jgi:hypothetical protein
MAKSGIMTTGPITMRGSKGLVFGTFLIGALHLFRISDFGFRIYLFEDVS